jgi:MoxR-like ATPase
MPEPGRIIELTAAGIDWHRHDAAAAKAACARLARHRGTAYQRRLEAGARRFQPSRDLVNAIDAALVSGSPLLLTGDPGTGKTQVAWFLAEYFRVPLFDFQVRSDTTALALRYDFDAVAYLRDAYLTSIGEDADVRREVEQEMRDNDLRDPRSTSRYLKPGRLWETYEHEGDCVLLIDEIDKAPRDFPNDLLQELSEYRFAHPFERGRMIERGEQPTPILVITSNAERRLPDAFLRRCVLHHIWLNGPLLERILDAWGDEFAALGEEGIAQALRRFLDLREQLQQRSSRPPGTAELLVWLTVLSAWGVTADQLQDCQAAELPALECLVKDHDDRELLG